MSPFLPTAGGLGLRLVDLHVPGAVRSGEPVQLRCEYDLENAELYSVKWYKNNVEFYRYLPSDVPPGQSYELLGTFVDVSCALHAARPPDAIVVVCSVVKYAHLVPVSRIIHKGQIEDKNNVFLEKTDLNTEGMYGCEVSTEGPGFKTVKGERELRIYVLPEEGPVMEGFQPRYQVGRPSKHHLLLPTFQTHRYAQVVRQQQRRPYQVRDPGRHDASRKRAAKHFHHASLRGATRARVARRDPLQVHVVRHTGAFTQQRRSSSSATRDRPADERLKESNSPRILSEKSRYEVGDDVDVNCTSIITEHPVELRWFVNDHEVKGPEAVRFPNVRYADGTQAAVLGLRFRVEARHFSDSDGLRLKCTATQSRVVALSSEETVQGAHQRSSGFRFASDRAISSLDGGHIARLFCWWWILKTLRSIL
ncbi:hypothetical protein MRX96_027559 [Rhipicephalus microplus]